MERIWNKFIPLDRKLSNGASTPLKPHTSSLRGRRKVFVGLSGGVDSAVSAALLKKQGYDVTGVFIKAWTIPGHSCTWREDRRSAMRAAAVLDIPFITLDLEKEYKEEVVDYMIDEYKKGQTPNPDVMCNKEIKFGAFLKFALENGADFVATGHYTRKREIPNSKSQIPNKSKIQNPKSQTKYKLLEGKDKNKDQSYFLWTLSQNQLKHILFPVGDLKKEEVRKLAKKFNLPQAERKDSQGICFLGQVDMKEFLKEYVGAKKGKVLDEKGNAIGEHDGALLYTIGERRGFRVLNKEIQSEPLHVVGKDIQKNVIIVASKRSSSKSPQVSSLRSARLFSEDFSRQLTRINWINRKPEGKIECRYRYRQEKIRCKIIPQKSKQQGASLSVQFQEPQFVASGQSIVFYQGEICLGGAIIA